MNKENICGKAFEELTNDEMMEVEGGIATSLSSIVNVTTLPCGIGASISCIGVSVYYAVKDLSETIIII